MTDVKVTKPVSVTLNGKLRTATVKVTKPVSPQPPFSKGGRGGIIVLCLLLFALCFMLFVLFCFPVSLQAKVSGVCSNCHTMHNSQGGKPVARGDAPWGETGVTAEPRPSLLIASCLGCHSSTTASEAIKEFSGSKIPIVFNTSEPTYNTPKGLAAGNFYYVSIAGTGDYDNKGHNIFLGNIDNTLDNLPPGEPTRTPLTAQITCAGKNGCHGDRSTETESLKAIKGAHHTDDTILKFGSISETGQGGSTGLSYRFLKGVHGGEDTDWQNTSSTTDHNEYKGATSFTDTSTISYLCGQCHGEFHSSTDVGSASPWLRHPTDIILPGDSAKEYRLYNGGTGTNNPYSLDAPVARLNIPDNASGFVNPGTNDAILMCLSCHRAHASPYFKLMRWDYKGWPACLPGCEKGCNVCHTTKN
jgi:hypothetical protein